MSKLYIIALVGLIISLSMASVQSIDCPACGFGICNDGPNAKCNRRTGVCECPEDRRRRPRLPIRWLKELEEDRD